MLAVLEEGRGDEQPMVAGLLDERDDGGKPLGFDGKGRESGVVDSHRDLGSEILEEVAGQPELRERRRDRHPSRAPRG